MSFAKWMDDLKVICRSNAEPQLLEMEADKYLLSYLRGRSPEQFFAQNAPSKPKNPVAKDAVAGINDPPEKIDDYFDDRSAES